MAGLLVSVRSATEALAAMAGGAAIIDVKEPDRGPLGRADVATWRAVRESLPRTVPVSVALGEMADWEAFDGESRAFEGVAYRKLGLAGSGGQWSSRWATIRRQLGPGAGWVAVAYADAESCAAPGPDAVLDAAENAPDCVGLLVDTWDKSRPSPLDHSWEPWVRRAQGSGRFVALAGGLDEAAIRRLAPLRPDLFAVRGAACQGGSRLDEIQAELVARLVRAAGSDGSWPAPHAVFEPGPGDRVSRRSRD